MIIYMNKNRLEKVCFFCYINISPSGKREIKEKKEMKTNIRNE